MLADLQRDFTAFLLRGDRMVAGALRPDLPPGRLNIYGNTVLGSLAEVLGHAHPSLRRALGDEAFHALARCYAALEPPRRPMLWSYGGGFADWLDATALDGLAPWLPDLGRLDWAMHEALFAADADPLDLTRLAAVPAEQAGALRLMPHPSVRLIRSRWPIHALWKAPEAQPEGGPDSILVGRADGEVRCARLDDADGALGAALLAGATLDEAALAGGDLQGLLARLLHNRLVVGFALDAGQLGAGLQAGNPQEGEV